MFELDSVTVLVETDGPGSWAWESLPPDCSGCWPLEDSVGASAELAEFGGSVGSVYAVCNDTSSVADGNLAGDSDVSCVVSVVV